MGIIELFMIAVGLSMDAFAVSVCKGLAICRITEKHMVSAGLWFGGFQALMPLVGYYAAGILTDKVEHLSHWIAFLLLAFIGGSMLLEALEKKKEEADPSMDARSMLPLAIATSIDALAVGVSLAVLRVRILPAVSFIGGVTFVLTALGIKMGSIFGDKYRSKAEMTGGLVLILIGIKILLEGIGML
ncbi:MAG: manganese efflux pump [Lachnospiraceae bacterium]|nr:manganese efflux pump [Lachnospiraceae bacterium]